VRPVVSVIVALGVSAGFIGCVDKTPPPLWPTPPPPPLATPIGEPAYASTKPEPEPVAVTPATVPDVPPGTLGPWQPGPDPR
jgi:hypothetical protein